MQGAPPTAGRPAVGGASGAAVTAIQQENVHPGALHAAAIKQEPQEPSSNGGPAANGPANAGRAAGTHASPGPPPHHPHHQHQQQHHNDDAMETEGPAAAAAPCQAQQPCAAAPDGGDAPADGDALAVARQAAQGARQVLQDILNQPQPQLQPAPAPAAAGGAPPATHHLTGGPGAPQPAAGGAERERGGAGSKGLRQFALMVCEQVRERGRTTYNEVADVLVKQLSADAAAAAAAGEGGGGGGGGSKDVDKTIRR